MLRYRRRAPARGRTQRLAVRVRRRTGNHRLKRRDEPINRFERTILLEIISAIDDFALVHAGTVGNS
ncbi:hypothetical protein [Nocardia salmonicida]|uniref:hypothetical protein n=1 Tax=Nocardia salmonicida TaxID=53431 RepID=UPI003CE93854